MQIDLKLLETKERELLEGIKEKAKAFSYIKNLTRACLKNTLLSSF